MAFVSYAQNFEDVTLWRALKDVERGFFIDIGAWDADLDSVTRAFSERGWRGINVEPVPSLHARIAQRRPRDVNLCAAVGAQPGTGAFFHVEGTGLSTRNAEAAATYQTQGWTVEPLTTEMVTLAELCRSHAPDAIHFLKLDCEGGERDVLAGADFTAFRPWIVLVEATEPNSQTPNHAGWEPILLQAGYAFAWFDGLNRFYVAEERAAALLPRVAMPPNCFDGFVLARTAAPWPPAARAPVPALVPGLPASRPAMLPDEGRIALAQRCRDCDGIPKVSDAGLIQHEPDGTAVQVMHNGLKVLAGGYSGPWMQRLITLCSGHHEPQEERVFFDAARVLPDDATMIELGGNWAYYSAWFLQGAPRRRAVVLEPDPLNRASGQRTMALNGLRASFVAGFAGSYPVAAAPFETERSGTLLLPCFSVPQLMDEHGIEHLDLLHCDAQGAELAVLQGCAGLFQAQRVGFVFVSTHVPAISGDPITHDRCLDLLRSCGGVIEVEHDAYESFSGDGLIVARFGPAPPGWHPFPVSRAPRNQGLFRHPSFDLADAWAQAGGPDAPVPDTDWTSELIKPLHAHGTVFPLTHSTAASLGRIGNCPVFEAEGAPGSFLVYGPYCARPAGRYECMFMLRVDWADLPPDAPVLFFDCTTGLAEPSGPDCVQACRFGELVPGEFVPARFAFTLPEGTTSLETRLRVAGPAPVAAVAAVAFRRLDSDGGT